MVLHVLVIGVWLDASLVMRKPAFCICENKDADQLRSSCAADQRLCFPYTDSIIPLLPKFEISSLYPSSVTSQPGLCGTWSETPKTGFLTTRLMLSSPYVCVDYMSLVLRKPVFGVSDQVTHKPGCTATEEG